MTLGHGEGFAGAGNAEENLVFFAGGDAVDELRDGSGLIALRGVLGDELEVHPYRISEERAKARRHFAASALPCEGAEG